MGRNVLSFFNSKKGSLIILVILLVSLVAVSVVFLAMAPAIAELINFARNQSAVAAEPNAMQLISRIELVWYSVPVLLIIIGIIWAIASALRKDQYNFE